MAEWANESVEFKTQGSYHIKRIILKTCLENVLYSSKSMSHSLFFIVNYSKIQIFGKVISKRFQKIIHISYFIKANS